MGLLDLSQTLLATVQAKGVVPNNWPWIPIVTGVLALIGAVAGTWINAYLTRGAKLMHMNEFGWRIFSIWQ